MKRAELKALPTGVACKTVYNALKGVYMVYVYSNKSNTKYLKL